MATIDPFTKKVLFMKISLNKFKEHPCPLHQKQQQKQNSGSFSQQLKAAALQNTLEVNHDQII